MSITKLLLQEILQFKHLHDRNEMVQNQTLVSENVAFKFDKAISKNLRNSELTTKVVNDNDENYYVKVKGVYTDTNDKDMDMEFSFRIGKRKLNPRDTIRLKNIYGLKDISGFVDIVVSESEVESKLMEVAKHINELFTRYILQREAENTGDTFKEEELNDEITELEQKTDF